MSNSRPIDLVAAALAALGLVGAVLELFYRPFRVAPIALLIALVAVPMSSEHRRLKAVAVGAIGIGFLIGASRAVWDSSALY